MANSVVIVALAKLFEYAEPTTFWLPGLSAPCTVTAAVFGSTR